MSEWLSPWIGVDLDKTLAEYTTWQGAGHIGEPVYAMAERVRQWLNEGKDVRIFTARVSNPLKEPERAAEILEFNLALHEWTLKHFRKSLPATCEKDMGCVEIYDDRARQVLPNTGTVVEPFLLSVEDIYKAANERP
jgi:hypothetical protein